MSDSKTHSISLIDNSKVQNSAGLPDTAKPTTDKLAMELVKLLTHSQDYKEQTLNSKAHKNGFKAKLLYCSEIVNNELASFFAPVVKSREPILEDKYNKGSSILILWDKNNIFAITTGRGIYKIANWKNNNFGISFGSLFSDSLSVSSMGKNVLEGNVHTNSIVYASAVKVSDIQSMDAVTRELHAIIDDASVSDRIIPKSDTRRRSARVDLKSGIKFGCALNYEDLTKLLKNITDYAAKNKIKLKELKDHINLLKRIDEHSDDYKKYYKDFVSNFWNRIQKNNIDAENIYIPLDAKPYLEADNYKITYNEKEYYSTDEQIQDADIAQAFNSYMASVNKKKTWEAFADFLSVAHIQAYDSSSNSKKPVLEDTVINLITGDNVSGKSFYFIVEGSFYLFENNLINRVNKELSTFLKSITDGKKLLGISWGAQINNEDEFNAAVVKQTKLGKGKEYYLLHKNIVEYMEFADILVFDGSKLSIVHVKDGYDTSMRSLSRQIELSVDKYISFMRNPNTMKSYMEALYNNARCEKLKPMGQVDSAQEFKKRFPKYKDFASAIQQATEVNFVAAIHGLKNHATSHSITAKYCLNEVRKFCLAKDANFTAVWL